MRAFGLCLLAAVLAPAQTPPGPVAVRTLVYGVLLERDPQPESGQISVRLADNQVLRFRFDAKTYVVREETLVDISRLRIGDRLEVLSDAVPGSLLRYARDIHVLGDAPLLTTRPDRPAARPAYSSLDDSMLFGADLTFSGVVFRLTADRLVLHTRDGEKVLDIRPTTRFIADGKAVDAADLKLNTRVFVKAGTGLYGQAQAYQVIWGDILPAK